MTDYYLLFYCCCWMKMLSLSAITSWQLLRLVYAPSGAEGKGLLWAALVARWLADKSGPQPAPTHNCFVSTQSIHTAGKLCDPLPQARQAPSRLVGFNSGTWWLRIPSWMRKSLSHGRKVRCLTIPHPHKGISAAALFFYFMFSSNCPPSL